MLTAVTDYIMKRAKDNERSARQSTESSENHSKDPNSHPSTPLKLSSSSKSTPSIRLSSPVFESALSPLPNIISIKRVPSSSESRMDTKSQADSFKAIKELPRPRRSKRSPSAVDEDLDSKRRKSKRLVKTETVDSITATPQTEEFFDKTPPNKDLMKAVPFPPIPPAVSNTIRIRLRTPALSNVDIPSNVIKSVESLPEALPSPVEEPPILSKKVPKKKSTPKSTEKSHSSESKRSSQRRASLTTSVKPPPRDLADVVELENPEKPKNSKKPKPKPSKSNEKAIEEEPIASTAYVNNEFCSACSGAGALICCESCPKSFHFTCADPPIDQNHVPDDNWFCNECRAKDSTASESKKTKKTIKDVKGIWNRLVEKADRMNPKCFTIPKRIKRISNETEDIETKGKKRPTLTVHSRSDKDVEQESSLEQLDRFHDDSLSTVVQQSKTKIRERITEQGFCHACNRSAKSEKHLIRCDTCSLLWHLDCLPYPLAVYPSSHRRWTCPIHMDTDNLSQVLPSDIIDRALEASKTIVKINDWPSAPSLKDSFLPESSVRLQFGWSANAAAESKRINGCIIPTPVKEAYLAMRSINYRDVRIMEYYKFYSYNDQSVETSI